MAPTILLVDDEPDFCSALHDILEAAGYDVHQAATASEALALLDHLHPDLILSDVMMPGMDGLDFLRQVRARPQASRIKAIVVSAKGMPEDIEAARRAGADGYLVKPFSARELRETVESFLRPQPA